MIFLYNIVNETMEFFFYSATLLTLVWELVPFIFSSLGIKIYTHTERSIFQTVCNKLKGNRHGKVFNSKISGWVMGKFYLCHITHTHKGPSSVSIISTEKYYKNLIRSDEEIPKNVKTIDIFSRGGSFKQLYYLKETIRYERTPIGDQGRILEEIKDFFKVKKSGCVMIYGPPGCGKSTIGLLLASELKGDYTDSFCPLDPGDTLCQVVASMEKGPRIIMLEEFDKMIEKIHFSGVKSHDKIPTSISDKSSWNKFLDKIERGQHPDVLLVLTTNRTPEYIDSLDPSYIRKGRVDLRFEMTLECSKYNN